MSHHFLRSLIYGCFGNLVMNLSGYLSKAALVILIVASSNQIASGRAQEDVKIVYIEPSKTGDDRMTWWREARFGLFVHWGPVSLKGTEIGWSRNGPRRGRKPGNSDNGVPVDVYDNLYKEFNPVRFDAKEWASIALEAGMKYMVFTTKHHDGFANFDSKLTDYKITSQDSPFGRDITKELAEAFREAGMGVGFYYSQPDWRHADYRTETHDRYIRYFHGQVRELLCNYGKVDLIWFDGLGGSAKDWDAENLFKMIKDLQPEIIINNRCGLEGDYDTPEQRIGSFKNNRPWETCMTICRQWAWKPDDNLKSIKECIQTLVRVVGGDGNFLLNVGPMPDGRIEQKQIKRLKEIGQWLRKYGDTIYGARGGPFKPASWGASTYKGNRVFVHLLDCPEGEISLPPISMKVLSATLLTGGKVSFIQTGDKISLFIPETDRNKIDTIAVLQLNGHAARITPVSMGSRSKAYMKAARASDTFKKMADYGPDKAFDDDPGTRWATNAGTKNAWIEVDLGEKRRFSNVIISEAYEGRVEKFELKYKSKEEWITFYSGNKLGKDARIRFNPVKARLVRLDIIKANEGPTIWEFQIF